MAQLSTTFVHLSDLHFGAPFDLALWEILLKAIPPLRPNAIVVTGDLADNPRPRHFRKASNYLESLRDACEQAASQSCEGCQAKRAEAQASPSSSKRPQGQDVQDDTQASEGPAGPTEPPAHSHRPQLLVIPGNHDYRVLGNIRLGWVSRWIFDVYFGDPDAPVGSIGVQRRLPRYFRLLEKRLRGWWLVKWRTKPDPERTPALTAFALPDRAAAFFLYDSNRVPFFGALATGRVDPQQIAQTDFVVRHLLDRGLPTRAYRIALVHHHPVPIPYADKTSLTNREGFLVLHNAGTFMREMIKSDFDLILHGHKHYSNFTRVSYQLTPLDRGEIGIVASGTATVRNGNAEGRNAFNVIRIYQNERVEVEQFEFAAARSVQYAQHAPYPFELYTAQGLKDRAFRRALELQKFSARELTVSFGVSPEGNVKVTHHLRGMAVQRGRTKTYWPVSLGTPCGLVRKPAIEPFERAGLTWEPVSEPPRPGLSMEETLERMQKVYGHILFHRTLGVADAPMDFGYSHFVVNALARDAQEFALIQPPPEAPLSPEEVPSPIESLDYAVVHPIERLRLRVDFPSGLQVEPYVDVCYIPALITSGADEEGNLKPRVEGKPILDPNWTKAGSGNLHQEGATIWVLDVERPAVGCLYSLKWQLPGVPAQYVPARIVEEARTYRELLLRYRERRQAPQGQADPAASEVIGSCGNSSSSCCRSSPALTQKKSSTWS